MTKERKIEDTATLEVLLATLEPAVVRGQFRAACRRLEEYLEERIEKEGAQGGRALLEKMHLIAGDRRTKALNVEADRRAPTS